MGLLDGRHLRSQFTVLENTIYIVFKCQSSMALVLHIQNHFVCFFVFLNIYSAAEVSPRVRKKCCFFSFFRKNVICVIFFHLVYWHSFQAVWKRCLETVRFSAEQVLAAVWLEHKYLPWFWQRKYFIRLTQEKYLDVFVVREGIPSWNI